MDSADDFAGFENELRAIARGKRAPADLSITYNDLHGLWGGSRLTLRGDGSLEEQVRLPGQEAPQVREKIIAAEQVGELTHLLSNLRIWEQLTPNSMLVPDESCPELIIRLKGHTSRVWERAHEMRANNRLIQVKDWIQKQFEAPPGVAGSCC